MAWDTRGTTLFRAFLLNAFAAAMIATIIIETRFALDPATRPVLQALPEMAQTFRNWFCNNLRYIYLLCTWRLGYGSSLAATKHQPTILVSDSSTIE